MNPFEQQFRIATEHHRAGRLREAEGIYRQILAFNPKHPDALYRLGLIAASVGELEAATDLIARAAYEAPGCAEFHVNLGVLKLQQGQRDQATQASDAALALAPRELQTLAALGGALKAIGRTNDAIRCCR